MLRQYSTVIDTDMGCARKLTNIFRLCTFYDFEEKVNKLL